MIVCFYCYHSGFQENDLPEIVGNVPDIEVKTIKVVCAGYVDILTLLHPFEEGAERVYLFGCPEEECHNLIGSQKARKRVAHVQQILNDLGIGKDKTKFISIPRPIGLKT